MSIVLNIKYEEQCIDKIKTIIHCIKTPEGLGKTIFWQAIMKSGFGDDYNCGVRQYLQKNYIFQASTCYIEKHFSCPKKARIWVDDITREINEQYNLWKKKKQKLEAQKKKFPLEDITIEIE